MLKTRHLQLVVSAASAVVNGTVGEERRHGGDAAPRHAIPAARVDRRGHQPPPRRPNLAVRTREHITPQEAEALIVAARQRGGRYGQRDSTLILLAYRHGLRVSEIVALRWEQVNLQAGLLHVTRTKKGEPSTHPLRARELRALRQLQRDQAPPSPYLFTTERKGPMSPAGVRKLLARIGRAAKLPYPLHPHMLRHGCGFALAARGEDTRAIQAYLGHRSIQHTARYTALAPGRFKNFWPD